MITTPRPAVQDFLARLRGNPCCAAVTLDTQLTPALESRAPIVFLLRGNGLTLGSVIARIHESGKLAAVHLDLVDGVRADGHGISWLARSGADAIVTSHGRLMTAIREERAVAILRLLLSRRTHLDSAFSVVRNAKPDIIEFLPGVALPSLASAMPPLDVPLLAGGFIRSEADARAVIATGVIGLTTSAADLWGLDVGT